MERTEFMDKAIDAIGKGWPDRGKIKAQKKWTAQGRYRIKRRRKPQGETMTDEKITTEEEAIATVRRDGSFLEYVPVELRTAKVCLAAAKAGVHFGDDSVLEHVPAELRTAELCLAAVQEYGRDIRHVPDELMTMELCIAAIKSRRGAFEYVPEKLRTPELCLAAVQKYGRNIKHVPKEIAAHYGLGKPHRNQGRDDMAMANFNEAIKRNPNNCFVHGGIGELHLKLGRQDTAIASFDEAIRLDPDHAFAYSRRGEAHRQMGRYDEAIADFDKAIELDDYFDSWANARREEAYVMRRKAEAGDDESAGSVESVPLENFPGTKIVFASGAAAREYIGTEDAFTRNLGGFDKSARLKTDRKVATAEFIDFMRWQVLDWTPEQKERVCADMEDAGRAFSGYDLRLPEEIVFISTTGKGEDDAAYCRGSNVIVLPPDFGRNTVCHELFHIYSRNNPKVRDALYRMLSFEKCKPLRLPDDLFDKKIANPDTSDNDCFFVAEVDGADYKLMPILLSSSDYDEDLGDSFFDCMELSFIAVTETADAMTPLTGDDGYVIFDRKKVPRYFENIGKNTSYDVHPEEVLADNFTLLKNGETDLPDMEIIRKMEATLKAARRIHAMPKEKASAEGIKAAGGSGDENKRDDDDNHGG